MRDLEIRLIPLADFAHLYDSGMIVFLIILAVVDHCDHKAPCKGSRWREVRTLKVWI
jgi:hypothetical protein